MVLLVVYGLYGIRRSKRQNVNAITTLNLPYWGLIGIGVCSGLYHATLKYHTQMCKHNYYAIDRCQC